MAIKVKRKYTGKIEADMRWKLYTEGMRKGRAYREQMERQGVPALRGRQGEEVPGP